MCGSSPLARGLPGGLAVEGAGVGIIPARAGFTILADVGDSTEGDHPRSRGVYFFPGPTLTAQWGSSPLARGLHLRILGIPTTRRPTRLRLPSLPT